MWTAEGWAMPVWVRVGPKSLNYEPKTEFLIPIPNQTETEENFVGVLLAFEISNPHYEVEWAQFNEMDSIERLQIPE